MYIVLQLFCSYNLLFIFAIPTLNILNIYVNDFRSMSAVATWLFYKDIIIIIIIIITIINL